MPTLTPTFLNFEVPRMTGCTATASPDACPACAAGPTVTVPAGGTGTATPNLYDPAGWFDTQEFYELMQLYRHARDDGSRSGAQVRFREVIVAVMREQRKAVEAERYRCAGLAERVQPSGKCRCSQCEAIRSFARIIAADIRDPKKGL